MVHKSVFLMNTDTHGHTQIYRIRGGLWKATLFKALSSKHVKRNTRQVRGNVAAGRWLDQEAEIYKPFLQRSWSLATNNERGWDWKDKTGSEGLLSFYAVRKRTGESWRVLGRRMMRCRRWTASVRVSWGLRLRAGRQLCHLPACCSSQ